ncbi:DUF1302 domain-containing protein [Pseudomonas panipatensis]|uniref:DUF1302 domain-containing protein n=1 Tax=Pseudomonas panipatensis TaxID=428992 RepID=A0A1G8ELK9_9PSED|nr:DUF1302 family protein [Pseudomonas panipatensis]SDH70794.1 Protein of unknown function [Pseudomonas panipatensis]SMP68340.1 Protein of unknown function [Pseudomonas panipatensis]
MNHFASGAVGGSGGLRGGRWLQWMLGLTVIPFAAPAFAGTFSLGEEVNVDYIINLSYAAAYRLRDPSQTLVDGPTDPATGLSSTVNSDDGDRNFKRGSLINNRLSLLGDFDIKYHNYGAFLRVSSFYDDVYRHYNDNDSPDTVNKSGDHDQFTSRARKLEENRTRLLDSYVYGSLQTGDESMLNLRLGRQVVQWGESLFFPNIAGAQSPADATKANVPGTEVKDILLPVGQVSAQWQLTPLFGVSAYYQYEYKPTELDPVGTYFSYTDVVGPGAEFIRAAPGFNIPRGPDRHPRDSGQWGVSTHFAVTSESDISLYYLRYHDKNPNVEVNYQDMLPVDYSVVYFDDISLYGASFSTRLGDVNLAGEVSYKEGVPVLVDSPLGSVATRADATQSNLSAIYLLGPRWFSEQTTFIAEASYLHVNQVDPYGFAGERYDQLTNSRNSWAYQLMVTPSWNNVIDSWDMTMPLSFAQQVKGAAAVAGAFGGLVGEGDKRMSVGVTGKYLNNLELGLTYNGFLGSPNLEKRPLADRDYLAFSAKYSY